MHITLSRSKLRSDGWKSRFDTPEGNYALGPLGVLGVAILEGIAWDTLFS
jgi:hypothetical protein